MSAENHGVVVWEGRFQPIHLGHVSYVRHLLSMRRKLWIYVVDNELTADVPNVHSPVPDFSSIVDAHHEPAKNPLPFWLRLELVQRTIVGEFGADAPITVWGGRRMDLHWSYVSRALPPDRVFVLSRRDAFEDSKSRAWESLGERVERVDELQGPDFSASDFRSALREGRSIERFLSAHTLALLEEHRALDDIRAGIGKAST